MKKSFFILSLIFVISACSEIKVEDKKEDVVNLQKESIDESGINIKYVRIKPANENSKQEYLGCYIKKEDGIYDSDNSLIKDVDLETFKVLGSCYAKDKNHIYYSSKILNDVDYSSFENIEKSAYSIAKDKNNFYYLGNKIDVDYSSFEVLNDFFAKDKNFVYYVGDSFEKIKNLDAKSTVLLNKIHIKDQDSIFCNGMGMISVLFEIKKADIKTFSILGVDDEVYSYAKDKNNCYRDCEIVSMSECDKILKENN